MKYVQVLQDTLVTYNTSKDGENFDKEVWSFYRYLVQVVLADPAMGTGYEALKAGALIQSKFEKARIEDWVELEDEHWEMIRNTVLKPKGSGILPSILQQFLPYMEAIVEKVRDEEPVNDRKFVD